MGYGCFFVCVAAVGFIFFPPGESEAKDQELALARCALLYSDPHFNDLTFGMTDEKQLCRRALPHFRHMIHTSYTVTGSALRLIDSTHSLVGLSVARGRAMRDHSAPELSTLAVFSDEKLVATLQFGEPDQADRTFVELSDAIATAQMLQILAGVPR
jgi:hypothetical protein